MNILVTNDDGIDSPGLWALAEALSHVGNILLVAPEEQQSGIGTGVSFSRDGVTINNVPSPLPGVNAYAIGGTPSDCVIIGLKYISKNHIDLIVSGINIGPNVGRDIPYSGTVMATLGGFYRKIPSIAVSLAVTDKNEKARFDVAAQFAATVAVSVKTGDIDARSIININVPNLPPGEIKGVKVTRTADFGYVHLAELNGSPGKAVYNTVTRQPDEAALETGTDVWAIKEGYISVTPIKLEVTHHELIPVIEECVEEFDCGYLGNML